MLDGKLGEFELNLGRFASMLILCFPAIVWKRPNLILEKTNMVTTLVMALLLFALNYATYAATTYIPSGTANTCFCISYMTLTLLVDTIWTACTERRIRCVTFICDSLTIAITLIGIICVIQPSVIFGVKPYVPYKSYCNPFRFVYINSTNGHEGMDNASVLISGKDEHNIASKYSYLGYIYGFCGGAISTGFVYLGKYTLRFEMPLVVCTWMAVVGTILSVACITLFESFVLPSNAFCNTVLVFHALLTGAMTILAFLVLDDVPGNDLSVITSLGVPTVFIFQFTILKNASPNNGNINTLSIVAAVGICLTSVLKPLTECLRLHNKQ